MSSTDARQHALIRVRDACQRDECIIAAFVGGSITATTADDVSDVDLYAVTLQPDYERFFARRQAFMRTRARPLLLVDTLNFEGLGFDMLHFVLDDRVYGELALGHAGNLSQACLSAAAKPTRGAQPRAATARAAER